MILLEGMGDLDQRVFPQINTCMLQSSNKTAMEIIESIRTFAPTRSGQQDLYGFILAAKSAQTTQDRQYSMVN
jgi:hypothetical protein